MSRLKLPLAMFRTLLVLARFLLAAWVGAATLYVIISIREVTHPGFGPATRDQLVLLRFPLYYAFGFAVLGGALCCQIALLLHRPRRGVLIAACGLTCAALGLMAYDYPCVYRPLAAMITPPGQPRPTEFASLHWWSETVNALQLGCALAAGISLSAMHDGAGRQNAPVDASATS